MYIAVFVQEIYSKWQSGRFDEINMLRMYVYMHVCMEDIAGAGGNNMNMVCIL